jgi:hypothetical protein
VRYLVLGLFVFGVNRPPTFGPPTWSLLVYARQCWLLNPVLLFVLGGFAAGADRLVTYLIHVAATVVVDAQLGSIFSELWRSPWSITLQLLLLLALAMPPLVPWRHRAHTGAP